jgi:glycosyltransferase involved in cell wall biosynthesis
MQQQFAEHHGIQAAYIPHASFMPNYPDGQSPFSGPTFVYMGSFYEAYDHDILFQAARILSKRGIHPPMEIIGQGPDLEKWRTFIDQNGMHNLTLPGFMTGEDLWRHLRHAHTLLFPIRWSRTNACRCPGKTFMYMHAQRPVITCDVGEVTVQLGNLARYVPCTAEAFAEAIASAYKVPMPADVPYPISTWDQKAKQLLEVIGHEATEAASVPLRQTPAEPSALGMSRGDF